TSAEIHEFATQQIYDFCHSQNLLFVWIYLYSHWYTEVQWVKWARSARDEIPAGKTTMLVEAHWRVLKRIHLHHHNRPRTDYLVFIMISRQCRRLILSFNQKVAERRVVPSWENEFRAEWRKLNDLQIDDDRNELYQVDVERWVCSCPYFIHNRFLLCKHLVNGGHGYGNSVGLLQPRRYLITRKQAPPYIQLIHVRQRYEQKYICEG
ncbi:hypothetical protein DM01DRAFT_1286161, partial [Hesseltinella vesiculosa]